MSIQWSAVRKFTLGLAILIAVLAVHALSALIGIYFFGDVGAMFIAAPILLAVLLAVAWEIGDSL